MVGAGPSFTLTVQELTVQELTVQEAIGQELIGREATDQEPIVRVATDREPIVRVATDREPIVRVATDPAPTVREATGPAPTVREAIDREPAVRVATVRVATGQEEIAAGVGDDRTGGEHQMECVGMCDYSLQTIKSRPAKVGEKLTTHDFGTGTRGFAAPEDPTTAVCVLPGTELVFAKEVAVARFCYRWTSRTIRHTTAIFRQVDKDLLHMNHDALEFPDGQIVILTKLCEGQEATILQLPARPTCAAEELAQKRVAYLG
jgi:hypothetical protein